MIKEPLQAVFPVNHTTTLKQWEDFLLTTLKIQRMKAKNLKIQFSEELSRKERIQRKIGFEQAMWDKFLCKTYMVHITTSLYLDPKTSLPPLYTSENTGLEKMLTPTETYKPLITSSKDVIDIHRKFTKKDIVH